MSDGQKLKDAVELYRKAEAARIEKLTQKVNEHSHRRQETKD